MSTSIKVTPTIDTTASEIKQQLSQEREQHELSGKQESHKQREVQNVANQLRLYLIEGQTLGPEAVSELLIRAEEFLIRTVQVTDIDPETRKVIEDIASLVVTAKQMERNKGIADRLQRIAEESQKAVESMKRSGMPRDAKKASEEAGNFVETWRPVFQLLIRSRDFRQLFVDATRIARRIVSRQTKPIVEEAKQRFLEGQSITTIAATAKEVIKEKSQEETPVTDEELETLLDEWQRVMVVLAQQPTYREGISRLFTLFDMFRYSSKHDVIPGGIKTETHVRRAQLETEELVASFAGRETFDQWKFNLQKLIELFENRSEWNQYLTELRNFILSTRSEEEVRSDQFKQESKNLANRARELVQQLKDENEVDNFLKSSEELMENIKNDEYVKLLRQQAGIISSDISFVDTEGKVQVDFDMLSKLQSVLLPVLAEYFKYIPLPRIERFDSKREFWLDNITLCGYDIIPENIHFHLESESDLSMKSLETRGHTRLVIRLEKFRTELKNMKFFYKKKTFPELMDNGIVSFRIGGDGAKLTLVFNIEKFSNDAQPHLTEGYADFRIRNMDIDFDKDTLTHDVLVPMITNLSKMDIQHEIERVVEQSLTSVIQKLGDQLTQTLGQVNRPFLSGLDTAKETLKKSEMAQVYANRREKLME
jgi:hypothetical protein